MSKAEDDLAQGLRKLEINSGGSTESSSKSKAAKPTECIEFVLCDTAASFNSAISILQRCSCLAIDCEGLHLGVLGGSLSLLCIRSLAPEITQNFLFDFVTLKCSFKPLFDLLTSPRILKVMFDGRKDFSALYHGYNVRLVHVIDLQLADVKSRFARGELSSSLNKRRLQGLLRCFTHKQIKRQQHMYKNIHVLQGLGSCLKEHHCKSTSTKQNVDHSLWMSRPLSPEYLGYAAHDVEIIDVLHSHFICAGYIDRNLLFESQNYVAMWSDAPPRPEDNYRSHPILPLEILNFSNKPSNTLEQTPTISCQGCFRQLSVASFPRGRSAVPHSGTAQYCWVCLAVPEWLETSQLRKELRQREKAMKEAKKNEELLNKGIATTSIFGDVPTKQACEAKSPAIVSLPTGNPASSANEDGNGNNQLSATSRRGGGRFFASRLPTTSSGPASNVANHEEESPSVTEQSRVIPQGLRLPASVINVTRVYQGRGRGRGGTGNRGHGNTASEYSTTQLPRVINVRGQGRRGNGRGSRGMGNLGPLRPQSTTQGALDTDHYVRGAGTPGN